MEKFPGSSAENLGRAIQLRRVELGLKRGELAIAAGLSYPYVSEIENGRKEPSAKALRQLADALDLAPSDLVTLTDRLGASGEAPSLLLQSDPPASERRDPAGHPKGAVDEHFFGMAHPSALSDPGRDGVLERWISDTVERLVRAELARWSRTELAQVVRTEVEAAIRRRED